MGPDSPLPLPGEFTDPEAYVDSLLEFSSSSELLRTLCGGIHILDFFTRTPDLYSCVLPAQWRNWFRHRNVMEILDLLMREDLTQFRSCHDTEGGDDTAAVHPWRGGPPPPEDLLQYIRNIRKHSLNRTFRPVNQTSTIGSGSESKLSRHIAVGMNVKKIHEVDNFAQYVEKLTTDIAVTRGREITHLVDFGSGQNYLGRALASEPYNKHVVAVESRPHNIEGARNMDVLAKLVEKPKTMRNKKQYRAQTKEAKKSISRADRGLHKASPEAVTAAPSDAAAATASPTRRATLEKLTESQGSIQYVEQRIENGDLSQVIDQVLDSSIVAQTVPEMGSARSSTPFTLTDRQLPEKSERTNPSMMVISLHSCGNLLHHGLRSLVMNPAVHAVAMIGCCYNLVTERLGPSTYKLPILRPHHPRLEATSSTYDPHGFPMSERLCNYPVRAGSSEDQSQVDKGIRLNITARMMAVQAPQNWGKEDSEAFFTRHFYRALLQRIFLDRGVVSQPQEADGVVGGASSGGTQPIVLGSLRKACYSSFAAYVRGAVAKLVADEDSERAASMRERMCGITDDEILDYEERYAERKKELSVVWSLMAFSAAVVEAVIVVDRWMWLKEQKEVAQCWVEPVFQYGMSPRNLVVVGVKT